MMQISVTYILPTFLMILGLAPINQMVATSGSDGIFTSNEDLRQLIYTKSVVLQSVEKYIKEEESRIQRLKGYVEQYNKYLGSADGHEEDFVSNPLNSFILIKKLTSDFNDVYDLIKETSNLNKFSENITDSRESNKWPTDEDLKGAASALIRLQEVYKINTRDMRNGRLNGVDYGPQLTAHDCFELGRQTYNEGDHYRTEIWMTEALSRYDEEDEKTVSKGDIYEYLGFSAYVQGHLRRALKFTNLLLKELPNHPRAIGNKLYYENAIMESGGSGPSLDGSQRKGDDGLDELKEDAVLKEGTGSNAEELLYPETVRYQRLCRGESNEKKKFDRDLKCFLDFGKHPFMKIAPIKAEKLYSKPDIYIFHNVISDNEIETIKNMANPRFKRATVQNAKTGELETANYRISKTAWIKSEENDVVKGIYQRVHDVTGLNMETSEELQVSNYGIGGHYDPHFDFARREEKDAFSSLGTGNRIATWLFYESEVEQGGATVFPVLDLTLWPQKGSAVFWFNLYRNGEGNEDTRHAACPVLKGTKWVSNFWIHERGQEFTRPCALTPFE
ncbi:prolyl 4-hydroxylase subunit alpha-1 [Lepeophtheirus salmonis]|uniref:procollagen-proline 4-dioxygenase n=1 Tax=Lepeophtheirus salmonis TaxID=72036 RepID=A0A0K2T7W8_LEPSM|nr:prolyl 4-hydroxylase subunit alpha-1-like [Lepeophtheirus salmonis]